MHKIVEYMRYPSTWSGIAKILGMAGGFLGYQISDELAASIAASGVAISGLISLLWSDSDIKPNPGVK